MASEPVHPLRISKGTPATSPSKMPTAISRPLSEIGATEMRRNSPSWHQTSPQKPSLNTDSSPFQPSPVDQVKSPRVFWQNRNSENHIYGGGPGSPSPNRRSSIERLQRASRVKNSNILALEQKQEYDPTRIPHLERPLAKVQGSPFGLRSPESEPSPFDLSKGDSKSFFPSSMNLRSSLADEPQTPTREQASPTKSSLSSHRFKNSVDQDWSGDSSILERELPSGRSLHRHAKSVTFDAAPPQINEYEMATPDISSIGSDSREGSYESIEGDEDSVLYDPGHHMGQEDSFDASLEDTDKTPVVGPDDWRRESSLLQDDRQLQRYERSPMPEGAPSLASAARPTHIRSDSANSNGEHRPLPPLPGAGLTRSQSNASSRASPGLSATAERMLGSHRSLPSPPPAFSSKSDIQNIGNGKMSLEERLKLMMLSDNSGKTAAEQQRERRLRRGAGRERLGSPGSELDVSALDTSVLDNSALEHQEEDDTVGDISGFEDYQLPTRISRESIMRRVNGNDAHEAEVDFSFSSPAPSSSPQRGVARSPERYEPLDPDVPIPSTEDSMIDREEDDDDYDDDMEGDGSVIIHRTTDDEKSEVFDLYQHSDVDYTDDEEEEPRKPLEESDGSHYSENDSAREHSETIDIHEDPVLTPRAQSPVQGAERKNSLPELAKEPEQATLSSGLSSFMLPEAQRLQEAKEHSPAAPEPEKSQMFEEPEPLGRPITPDQPAPLSKPEYDGSGWGLPDDEDYEDPGTPESVIHHPISDSEDEELPKESPAIPERLATVKASGSKLKTRVSNTPSDLAAMREARRQVSYEVPIVPPIPEKHRNRLSQSIGTEHEVTGEEFLERHPSFKNRSLTLDLDLGLSLDQDFERVIESQKRGYLMRQNTKLVAASDKDADDSWKARSAGNSPIKKDRPQSWTVEPWNGQTRQRSLRKRTGATGPVPPLPGQESNANALQNVAEEDISLEMATPESGERGRLFVKVMGVKDLDLPIPKNERSWFSLTLDNGVHCVTTAWLELARNAPIGQEFELVVPNDLEFQLTLNVKLEKPAPVLLPVASAKTTKHKTSTFSRVFTSPKKRKELELRHREEEERLAQQQRDAQARQRKVAPTAYDLLSPIVAEDGSFARSYVCLKEHENRCFGRPYMAEVACFNEWATEEAGFASSVKSKRGNTAVVRRAPYKIGKLELQLLFVPRPKNSTDEDMPKSMNSCIRELKASEERLARNWEGHLSQQGGDCPYWRRRYFKLVGTKLTAYHEATRQPRATINLSNAKRLIDDRRALMEKETTGKNGRRRRSAFAEEEEGYMFVEEGFRIRFNNGEVIDFYADTAEDKEGWMRVLSDIIGRADGANDEETGVRSRAKWCELVLKREEQLRRRAEGRAEGRRVHSRTKSMYL
ncbi:hypothetical protein B0I35DRAFT_403799 [Stachybotrys elegans]|uniref:PH domain-containing protein n=1 Tax=Stachybotrys elegans TaxID=80388 RepID=A0A8K0T6T8_9HYPO|nr:hypothetical protein B0I35DRAFT_403799 [Stachybotrys elegans]